MGRIGNELVALELLALGRIPRCTSCPRYRAMQATHAGKRDRGEALPAVPLSCSHQVCAPLVVRLTETASDLPLAG